MDLWYVAYMNQAHVKFQLREQEFDSREAAEESVAKYHEGFFMGNKIRVELSHGGGRTAKFAGDPGACFKCGQMGHWARYAVTHSRCLVFDKKSIHRAENAPIIQPRELSILIKIYNPSVSELRTGLSTVFIGVKPTMILL